MTKSGDLNNGLKYSAGFSFESDCNDTAGASGGSNIVTSDEAFFIEIGSGSTSVLIGLDKFPSVDQSAAPRVAENAATALGTYAASTYSQSGNTINQSFTAGVIQKTPIGQIALNYSPDVADKGTGDTALVSAGGGNTGYELTYRGKPISAAPGLDIFLGRVGVGLLDREILREAHLGPGDNELHAPEARVRNDGIYQRWHRLRGVASFTACVQASSADELFHLVLVDGDFAVLLPDLAHSCHLSQQAS